MQTQFHYSAIMIKGLHRVTSHSRARALSAFRCSTSFEASLWIPKHNFAQFNWWSEAESSTKRQYDEHEFQIDYNFYMSITSRLPHISWWNFYWLCVRRLPHHLNSIWWISKWLMTSNGVRLFKISLKSALDRIKVQKEDNLSITGLISEYFVSSKMIEKLARETLGRMIDEAPEKLYEMRNESVNHSSVFHATTLRKQHYWNWLFHRGEVIHIIRKLCKSFLHKSSRWWLQI